MTRGPGRTRRHPSKWPPWTPPRQGGRDLEGYRLAEDTPEAPERAPQETQPEQSRSGQAPPQPVAFVTEKWQWGLAPRPKVLYLNLAVLLVLGTWAGLMWVTPYMNEPGTLVGLDGLVGPHDSPVDFDDLDPVSRFMYRAGDSQCHQRENRTVTLNDNQMPFCARCVAIYTFMAAGVALTVFPRMPGTTASMTSSGTGSSSPWSPSASTVWASSWDTGSPPTS